MERLTHKEFMAVERHLRDIRKIGQDYFLSNDWFIKRVGDLIVSVIDLQIQKALMEFELEAAEEAVAYGKN